MTEIIWLNVLIVGLIAAAAAVVLYFTAKKFAVENNPLADKIDTKFIRGTSAKDIPLNCFL